MSRRSYPQIHEKKWQKGRNRPFLKTNGCSLCGEKIKDDDDVYVVEVEVSYMRGDDVVLFIDRKCYLKQKIRSMDNEALIKLVLEKGSR
jgi:hypothetical protein